jgi:hypothetical protein
MPASYAEGIIAVSLCRAIVHAITGHNPQPTAQDEWCKHSRDEGESCSETNQAWQLED